MPKTTLKFDSPKVEMLEAELEKQFEDDTRFSPEEIIAACASLILAMTEYAADGPIVSEVIDFLSAVG